MLPWPGRGHVPASCPVSVPEVFPLITRLVCAKLLCNKLLQYEVVNGITALCLPPLHLLLLQNPGMPPVDMLRDPRIGRLWTKYKETDLPVPKFKVSTLTESMVPAFSLWKIGAVKSCRHTPLAHLREVEEKAQLSKCCQNNALHVDFSFFL